MTDAIKAKNYKTLKEAFYTGLNGGSVWEINAVTAILSIAIWTWSILKLHGRLNRHGALATYAIDWLLNCAAPLAAVTIYSSSPALLNTLVLLPVIASFIWPVYSSNVKSKGSSSSSKAALTHSTTQLPLPRKPFVTMYRGSMLVMTCIGILAVDFPVFPRRFAKVETWGTSLMDLGVGSFVFSAGVIGATSILKLSSSRSKHQGLASRLFQAGRKSAALLALGLVRLMSVKSVDYAEHVSEYGVHWNFFVTLGLLPPLVVLLECCSPTLALATNFGRGCLPSLLALAVAALYELALDQTSLTRFIIAAPRVDLLSQNREGLCSFWGYLAIFLAGQGAGLCVLPRLRLRLQPRQGKPVKSTFTLVKDAIAGTISGQLACQGLIYCALLYLSTAYYSLNLTVSRRLANLPYVLWIAAYNCLQLSLLSYMESWLWPRLYLSHVPPPASDSNIAQEPVQKLKIAREIEQESRQCQAATSPILQAFNRNGLAVFLLANLLTGAVNLTLPTLYMHSSTAMGVLLAYMGILASVAVALDRWNINVKI